MKPFSLKKFHAALASLQKAFSEALSKFTIPNDSLSAPPTPLFSELFIASILIPTELRPPHGSAMAVSLPPRQMVKINPNTSAQSMSLANISVGSRLGREGVVSLYQMLILGRSEVTVVYLQ